MPSANLSRERLVNETTCVAPGFSAWTHRFETLDYAVKDTHGIKFNWSVYNVSNSKRFDPLSLNSFLDVYGSTFADYTRLSTKPRVMEFSLRYEF